MRKSLIPNGSRELVLPLPPRDGASAASFTNLPPLLIDRANLPGTAKQLDQYFGQAGHLFQRGGHVVRVVHSPDGEQIQPLNVQRVRIEAHKVCQPAECKLRRGEMVLEKMTLPSEVANLYLNFGEDLNLPLLRGLCAAPLLGDDGSTIVRPAMTR